MPNVIDIMLNVTSVMLYVTKKNLTMILDCVTFNVIHVIYNNMLVHLT